MNEVMWEEFIDGIFNELAEEVNKWAKELDKDVEVTKDDFIFDDSRDWSLYIYGSKLDLPVYKFGAYREYLGGGVRGSIEHNGREDYDNYELGELFAEKLGEIEEMYNSGYEDAEFWELPSGVLLK